jgi:ankyrin repeat protein
MCACFQARGGAFFVDARTKYGSTPLLFAIKNSHSEATRILIEDGGADCSVTDKQVRCWHLLLS